MKNNLNKYLIVAFSLFVGLLHIVIDHDYNGPFKNFITGYLIDILLPMNLYLLFQIAFRNRISLKYSRMIGIILPFFLGVIVEILQLNGIQAFGSTYDPLDIVMYGTGVILGLIWDVLIIDKLEKKITHGT